jgi:hypothetical protein
MTDAEQAMKAAQAKHLARLTGPQTCCVKVGPDNMPCGQRVEYLAPEESDAALPPGWYHAERPDLTHRAVPASYAR